MEARTWRMGSDLVQSLGAEQAVGPDREHQDDENEDDDFAPLGLPEADDGLEKAEHETAEDAAAGIVQAAHDGAREALERDPQAHEQRSPGNGRDQQAADASDRAAQCEGAQ